MFSFRITRYSSFQVVGTHDASNPVKEGKGTPILTCDVSAPHRPRQSFFGDDQQMQ